MTEAERSAARAFFDRRIGQQAIAGVDVFILETFYSVEECTLAIPFVKAAGLPVVATLTFRDVEYTRDGHPPAEAARRLVDAGADVVGLNCMRPWYALEPLARQMRQAVSAPLCVQPTAYELEPGETFNRPLSVANLWTRVEPRVVTRYAMADYAREARGMGIAFIGACCGALPYHIRAIAEVLGKPVGLPDVDRGYQEAQAP